jgi:uncharacterized protein YndB with AHSA1/START domain
MTSRSADARPAEDMLVITREFDAPRELVFAAWTDPRHVRNWWGPRGFTSPRVDIDFRVGGSFIFGMRAPDGKQYWNQGEYLEIAAPERIVSVMRFSDAQGNRKKASDYGLDGIPDEMRDVVTFEAIGPARTRLTLRRDHALAVARRFGEDAGWNQSLDRFGAILREIPSAPAEIVQTRVIAAPRELVFEAWTDAKHIGEWWGPRGFRTTVHEMDVRPGGDWRLTMHGPDGTDYPNHSVFVEIDRPARLVFDHVSPPRFRMTATFEDDGGNTRLTARLVFESAELRDKIAVQHRAVEGLHDTLARCAESVEAQAE